MSPLDRSTTDARSYDELAEACGIEVGSAGWMIKAKELLGFERPPGPHKKASPYCESGKRDYCTCDSCY